MHTFFPNLLTLKPFVLKIYSKSKFVYFGDQHELQRNFCKLNFYELRFKKLSPLKFYPTTVHFWKNCNDLLKKVFMCLLLKVLSTVVSLFSALYLPCNHITFKRDSDVKIAHF